MNKIKFLAIGILIICFSCDIQDKGTVYTTSATIYLINETSVVVKSDDILGYIIQPGETLIHTESLLTSEYSEKPSIDNYQPFPSGSRKFIYGDDSQCELGFHRIENYEDRKEVSELEFEFTFRFTEEKRENSESCNL
ncbi:MAG: hypothetical protein COB60_07865 [Flavobacteriaceae bacterium]|nr:MAG: hypothetical protein COB60_07865 [Flavobacteriaceae bacterium]